MDSYFDMKAIPSVEILQSSVVAALMQGLHTILPKYDGRVGLDFPGYGQNQTLGGIIRIIGTEEDIKDIGYRVKANSGIRDYSMLGSIQMIPSNVNKFSCYKRNHVQGNSRLRRHMKRQQALGTWTVEKEQALVSSLSTKTHMPHVTLRSLSSNQNFMLFVKKQTKLSAVAGLFNAYGLSIEEGTVPCF